MFLNQFLLIDQINFFHQSEHCNLLFLQLEENIACKLSSNDKTKSLITPWKLGSIKKTKYRFCSWIVILDWYLLQLIVSIILHYPEKIKLRLEHKISYYLLYYFIYCFVLLTIDLLQYQWRRGKLFDQVDIRLTSQLISGISSVLQNILRYFNGSIILTSFVPLFPVFPVICCLNLSEILLIIITRKISNIIIIV